MSANLVLQRIVNIAQQSGKHIPSIAARWVSSLLILILAWTLGRMAWIWVPHELTIPQSSSSVTANDATSEQSYQLSSILRLNLFGRYDGDSAPAETLANAPKTTLNLKLVGLVSSSIASQGLAVIANGAVQQLYGIDETIDGTRVVLRRVLKDRVILSNSGRDETLMLDGLDYNQDTQAAIPGRKKTEKTTGSKTPPAQTGKADLSSIKAEILKNPQTLLKYITLSQERDGAGLIGYRLGPGSDNRLFNQAGLKAGDIAIGINNIDLTNPAEMNRIWQSLSDASEISLTVRRDGQLHKVYIGL